MFKRLFKKIFNKIALFFQLGRKNEINRLKRIVVKTPVLFKINNGKYTARINSYKNNKVKRIEVIARTMTGILSKIEFELEKK